MTSRRWLAPLVAGAVLGGCAGRGPSDSARVADTKRAPCAVGERPGYFVPRSPDSPVLLLGCARLGVSGKRVELSGSVSRIAGRLHACVNPAYRGRGNPGAYIPARCGFDPPLSRFAVRDAARPRQGVRGYAYVIWGTAGASRSVVARFRGGDAARAATMTVPPELARILGAPPFRLFVVELPVEAACGPIVVRGSKPDATVRLPPGRQSSSAACRKRSGAARNARVTRTASTSS